MRTFVLSVALLTFTGSPALAQTFTRIIGSGDLAPGTSSPLLSFSEAPCLDDDHIAFLGSHQEPGGTFPETIYSNASGTFQKVIATGDPMPGHGAVPLQFLIRLTIDGDAVAIHGSSFVGGVARNAILSNAGGAMANVADQGDFIPGTFFTFTQIAGQDFSFGRGKIVFNGSGPSGLRGLYEVDGTGGPLGVVADSMTPAPGAGANYFNFGSPAVRDARVAFHANAGGQIALYDQPGVGTGPVSRLLGAGDLAPSGQPFTFVFGAAADEDDTLFYGMENGVRGLHAIVNGTLTTIVDSNTPIPGGTGTFAEFFEYTISNDRIVFDGHQTAPEGTMSAGVFTNVCGGIARVLGPGDVLDGRTVTHVRIDEDSLDENRLAMAVSFTDGTSAIYVADLTTIVHSGEGHAFGASAAPTIEGIGCPALGAPLRFHLRGAPVGGTGYLVIGVTPIAAPVAGGGTLLVSPDWLGAVVANAPDYGHPQGWLDVDVTIPSDTLFSGTTFYLQAAWMSPQPAPWRLTDRLEVSIP